MKNSVTTICKKKILPVVLFMLVICMAIFMMPGQEAASAENYSANNGVYMELPYGIYDSYTNEQRFDDDTIYDAESIIEIIPIDLLRNSGIYVYVGREYGFMVNNVYHSHAYSWERKWVSEVFIFDIITDISQGQYTITIKTAAKRDVSYRQHDDNIYVSNAWLSSQSNTYGITNVMIASNIINTTDALSGSSDYSLQDDNGYYFTQARYSSNTEKIADNGDVYTGIALTAAGAIIDASLNILTGGGYSLVSNAFSVASIAHSFSTLEIFENEDNSENVIDYPTYVNQINEGDGKLIHNSLIGDNTLSTKFITSKEDYNNYVSATFKYDTMDSSGEVYASLLTKIQFDIYMINPYEDIVKMNESEIYTAYSNNTFSPNADGIKADRYVYEDGQVVFNDKIINGFLYKNESQSFKYVAEATDYYSLNIRNPLTSTNIYNQLNINVYDLNGNLVEINNNKEFYLEKDNIYYIVIDTYNKTYEGYMAIDLIQSHKLEIGLNALSQGVNIYEYSPTETNNNMFVLSNLNNIEDLSVLVLDESLSLLNNKFSIVNNSLRINYMFKANHNYKIAVINKTNSILNADFNYETGPEISHNDSINVLPNNHIYYRFMTNISGLYNLSTDLDSVDIYSADLYFIQSANNNNQIGFGKNTYYYIKVINNDIANKYLDLKLVGQDVVLNTTMNVPLNQSLERVFVFEPRVSLEHQLSSSNTNTTFEIFDSELNSLASNVSTYIFNEDVKYYIVSRIATAQSYSINIVPISQEYSFGEIHNSINNNNNKIVVKFTPSFNDYYALDTINLIAAQAYSSNLNPLQPVNGHYYLTAHNMYYFIIDNPINVSCGFIIRNQYDTLNDNMPVFSRSKFYEYVPQGQDRNNTISIINDELRTVNGTVKVYNNNYELIYNYNIIDDNTKFLLNYSDNFTGDKYYIHYDLSFNISNDYALNNSIYSTYSYIYYGFNKSGEIDNDKKDYYKLTALATATHNISSPNSNISIYNNSDVLLIQGSNSVNYTLSEGLIYRIKISYLSVSNINTLVTLDVNSLSNDNSLNITSSFNWYKYQPEFDESGQIMYYSIETGLNYEIYNSNVQLIPDSNNLYILNNEIHYIKINNGNGIFNLDIQDIALTFGNGIPIEHLNKERVFACDSLDYGLFYINLNGSSNYEIKLYDINRNLIQSSTQPLYFYSMEYQLKYVSIRVIDNINTIIELDAAYNDIYVFDRMQIKSFNAYKFIPQQTSDYILQDSNTTIQIRKKTNNNFLEIAKVNGRYSLEKNQEYLIRDISSGSTGYFFKLVPNCSDNTLLEGINSLTVPVGENYYMFTIQSDGFYTIRNNYSNMSIIDYSIYFSDSTGGPQYSIDDGNNKKYYLINNHTYYITINSTQTVTFNSNNKLILYKYLDSANITAYLNSENSPLNTSFPAIRLDEISLYDNSDKDYYFKNINITGAATLTDYNKVLINALATGTVTITYTIEQISKTYTISVNSAVTSLSFYFGNTIGNTNHTMSQVDNVTYSYRIEVGGKNDPNIIADKSVNIYIVNPNAGITLNGNTITLNRAANTGTTYTIRAECESHISNITLTVGQDITIPMKNFTQINNYNDSMLNGISSVRFDFTNYYRGSGLPPSCTINIPSNVKYVEVIGTSSIKVLWITFNCLSGNDTLYYKFTNMKLEGLEEAIISQRYLDITFTGNNHLSGNMFFPIIAPLFDENFCFPAINTGPNHIRLCTLSGSNTIIEGGIGSTGSQGGLGVPGGSGTAGVPGTNSGNGGAGYIGGQGGAGGRGGMGAPGVVARRLIFNLQAPLMIIGGQGGYGGIGGTGGTGGTGGRGSDATITRTAGNGGAGGQGGAGGAGGNGGIGGLPIMRILSNQFEQGQQYLTTEYGQAGEIGAGGAGGQGGQGGRGGNGTRLRSPGSGGAGGAGGAGGQGNPNGSTGSAGSRGANGTR